MRTKNFIQTTFPASEKSHHSKPVSTWFLIT